MNSFIEILKNNYQGTIILAIVTFIFAIVQAIVAFFLNSSISKKLEKQKAELSQKLEDYRFSNAIRKEQAEKIAELFSRIRLFKSVDPLKKEEEKQKLNKQIWELTLWLPSEILEELYCLVDDTKTDYRIVLIQIRDYLNKNENEKFELDYKKIKDFK